MDKQTEQIYKSFNRRLQVDLAKKYKELRPLLANLIKSDRKWLANWSKNKPHNYALDDLKTQIESGLSMRQVIEHYGYHVNRYGRCRCMFHNGKNRNLGIYDSDTKFKCFVCGVQGDIFMFVMELFNLDFVNAIKKLSNDFGFELTSKVRISHEKQVRKANEIKESHNQFKQLYSDRVNMFRFLYTVKSRKKPTSQDPSTWHPLYTYAVHWIDQLERWLDKWAGAAADSKVFAESYREEVDGLW